MAHIQSESMNCHCIVMERRRGSFNSNSTNEWILRFIEKWQKIGNSTEEFIPNHRRMNVSLNDRPNFWYLKLKGTHYYQNVNTCNFKSIEHKHLRFRIYECFLNNYRLVDGAVGISIKRHNLTKNCFIVERRTCW